MKKLSPEVVVASKFDQREKSRSIEGSQIVKELFHLFWEVTAQILFTDLTQIIINQSFDLDSDLGEYQ